MPDPVAVLRASFERFRGLVDPLSSEQVTGRSYDDEWTIADVASHLGSGAEIFEAFLDAGLSGKEPPGPEGFQAVWDRWNATAPTEQVTGSVAANESLVARLEGLTGEQRDAFGVPMFGMQVGIPMLVGMRLSETTFHTWDIAVMADPTALLLPDAVEPMLDTVAGMIGRAMSLVEGGGTVAVTTSDPERTFVLDLDAAALVEEATTSGGATATMPAEAFLRLVAGRLDAEHTPAAVDADPDVLDRLRQAFPGF